MDLLVPASKELQATCFTMSHCCLSVCLKMGGLYWEGGLLRPTLVMPWPSGASDGLFY